MPGGHELSDIFFLDTTNLFQFGPGHCIDKDIAYLFEDKQEWSLSLVRGKP